MLRLFGVIVNVLVTIVTAVAQPRWGLFHPAKPPAKRHDCDTAAFWRCPVMASVPHLPGTRFCRKHSLTTLVVGFREAAFAARCSPRLDRDGSSCRQRAARAPGGRNDRAGIRPHCACFG